MKLKHAFLLIVMVLVLPCATNADDVAIYGTQSVTIEPNVLIIFDTSGSMSTIDKTDGGVADSYDPGTDYTGDYARDAVYKKKDSEWKKFADSLSALKCETIKTSLQSLGYAEGNIKNQSKGYVCGGGKKTLRMGNYLNYLSQPVDADRSRIDIAKEVVKELLAETTEVRFGLMRLNGSNGGRLIDACGTSNTTISSHVDDLDADGTTPIAEALAEAGLYFAGKTGYFSHTSSAYTSPIQERCQKNYVILFTDGEPISDNSEILYKEGRYMGQTIGDSDGDGRDLKDDGSIHFYPDAYGSLRCSDFLDDVADFLYKADLSSKGTGTSFVKQNIITHTIGFNIDHDLLKRTAKNGGGIYRTASRAADLKEAFEQILSTIAEESSVFVAPVVPVNREYRTAEGQHIYLAFFKPAQTGDWKGNLKKYTLSSDGEILDTSGNLAVNDDGTMKENSQSLWTEADSDGADVLTGGAGERIQAQTSRKFYTYTGSNSSLNHSSNLFDAANTDLTDLGVTATQINAVKSGNSGWPIGSIIHSEPVVVHYSTSSSVIFFGSNDGMFRAINDATGEELWAFVPPGQLSRLSLVQDNTYDYYVDGPPAVAYGDRIADTDLFAPDTVLVGERRGGSNYYALDISSSTLPKYKYMVDETFLSSSGGETLGQSWGNPSSCRVKLSSTTDAKVFILPGGYDNQQDLANPADSDTEGRALFAVKVSDGSLAGLNVNHGNWSDMTHSIVDLHAVDHDGDGITTRVYAGDMSGQVFVVADDKVFTGSGDDRVLTDKVPDGAWDYKNRLFSCDAGKLFYAPVPADVSGVETLYFGTGNRANPLGTETNRFYAVRNNWYDSGLTDSNLVNVTDETVSHAADLKVKKGWYFQFPNANEKVVSKALVDSKVVYFTTYTPTSATSSDSDSDPCAGTGARGVGRLYAVSYVDGTSVTDWGGDSKTRSTILPGNLPIATPVIKNRKIHVGTKSWDVSKDDRVDYFYWKQRQ